MQTANLINEKGLVDAEVEVPTPAPGVVEFAGRYYASPVLQPSGVMNYMRESLFVVSRDGYVTAGI